MFAIVDWFGVEDAVEVEDELAERDVTDGCTFRSFWRFRLRRRHRSEALARCHARLGRMWTGGYACKASPL